jgi:hypothetical protein
MIHPPLQQPGCREYTMRSSVRHGGAKQTRGEEGPEDFLAKYILKMKKQKNK